MTHSDQNDWVEPAWAEKKWLYSPAKHGTWWHFLVSVLLPACFACQASVSACSPFWSGIQWSACSATENLSIKFLLCQKFGKDALSEKVLSLRTACKLESNWECESCKCVYYWNHLKCRIHGGRGGRESRKENVSHQLSYTLCTLKIH